MEKVRLLLVDQDVHFVDLASRFLNNFQEIELVGSEFNGYDAFHKIRSCNPDAVLFDLVLPGLDGIALLRKVNALPNPPAMLCCTRFFSDVAMEALRDYGAAYVLFKPVELQALYPAILTCARLHRKTRRMYCDAEAGTTQAQISTNQIRNAIVSMGIPAKLIGCTYLAEAVRLARGDNSLTRNLSKGLYLEISRSMNVSPMRIERCIRNAISVAFQKGTLDKKLVTCPSNKEFINYLLRTIEQ